MRNNPLGKESPEYYWRSFFDVPNLLTWSAAYLSVVAGVGITFSGGDGRASWPLMCAALPIALDFIDGAVARRFFPTAPGRRLGSTLDTLADFAAFGCLPATILLAVLGSQPLVWVTGAVWVFCAQMRLAHFSYSADAMPPGEFAGLPSPYAAGLFLVGVTVLIPYGPRAATAPLCAMTAFVATMMLVPFRFRKPAFWWNVAFSIGVMLIVSFG